MQLVDRGAPTLTQAAVADFISEGHFERHLRRLRTEYGRRRKTLVEAIEKNLGDKVSYSTVDAGLHVMLYIPQEIDESALVGEASKSGVGIYAGAPYHLDPQLRPSILLGFSGLNNEEIKEGVARLSEVMRSVGKNQQTLPGQQQASMPNIDG
jgi:GntR family transcriptional regulator/MocR family aminotransferase